MFMMIVNLWKRDKVKIGDTEITVEKCGKEAATFVAKGDDDAPIGLMENPKPKNKMPRKPQNNNEN